MRSYRVHSHSDLVVGQPAALDERSSHHLARVLRVKVGDAVTVFNGDGNNYYSRVSALSKTCVTVDLLSSEHPANESPLTTHLGLAVSKGDRFDWAIKKATELGVSSISPILSQRVDVRLSSDRWKKKQEHWQQIVVSACEQSGRAVVPEVFAPKPLADWVKVADADYKFCLHPGMSDALPTARPNSVSLLIGPEGGLSNEEVTLASDHGFLGLNLGPRILRTETAPLVALSVFGTQWGDLSVI